MGLEDLETMERIFSVSHSLTSVTRYMSAYRRRIFIDMFFRQWDADKYQNLGTFLLNNYSQALKIIEEDSLDVQTSLASLNLSCEDLERYSSDQLSYFQKLGKESEDDIHAIAYVGLLEELCTTQ